MIGLISAVVIASLLGSLHCVGMCGAFLALSLDGPSRVRAQAFYHLGRLATYSGLGVLAGGVGSALDAGGTLVGLQRPAMVLAGVMVAGFGVLTLARAMGVRVRRAPVPAFFRDGVVRLQRAALAMPQGRRSLAIGMLTTLLPCGWLYAFVFTSAGTGSPILGGATMAAFWVGTLPALGALGAGLSAAAGPLRRHAPVLTAILVIVVGIATAVQRWNAGPLALGTGVRDRATLIHEVRSLDASEASCCDGHR